MSRIYITTDSNYSSCTCGCSPCSCSHIITYNSSPPTSNTPCAPCSDQCVDLLDVKCSIYNGDAIPAVGITNASTLLAVIQALSAQIILLQNRVTALENA